MNEFFTLLTLAPVFQRDKSTNNGPKEGISEV